MNPPDVTRPARRRTATAAAAAAAVLALMAGCSSSNQHSAPTTTPATSSPSSTGSSTTPPTSAVNEPATAEPAGGPLPAGFRVADLTWVGDNQGWALGTAPCAHPPCTSVAHTVDGGVSWAGLPAPIAFIPGVPPGTPVNCSATLACVTGIRFANATTGYVWGPSSLWLTTNGGHSWSLQLHDATDALEVLNGTAVRVTHPGQGCPPGCSYLVQSAPIGSTSWRTLPAPPLLGNRSALVLEGAHIYVAVFLNPAGGAQSAHTHFVRSADAGATWVSFDDPCGVTAGAEDDATGVTASPGGHVALACTPRTSQSGDTFVVTSADAAASFGPHHPIPTGPGPGGAGPIGAATGPRLAVAVPTYTSPGPGKITVWLSADGGVTWNPTLTQILPAAGGLDLSPYLGFQDATTGRAVLAARTIQTTTDGGAHWTAFTFP